MALPKVLPKVIYVLKDDGTGKWRLFSYQLKPDVEAFLAEVDDAKAEAWIKELWKLRKYRLFGCVPRLRYRYQERFKKAFPGVEIDRTDTDDNYRDDVRLIAEKLNRVPTVAGLVGSGNGRSRFEAGRCK